MIDAIAFHPEVSDQFPRLLLLEVERAEHEGTTLTPFQMSYVLQRDWLWDIWATHALPQAALNALGKVRASSPDPAVRSGVDALSKSLRGDQVIERPLGVGWLSEEMLGRAVASERADRKRGYPPERIEEHIRYDLDLEYIPHQLRVAALLLIKADPRATPLAAKVLNQLYAELTDENRLEPTAGVIMHRPNSVDIPDCLAAPPDPRCPK
jgi:hypothetical protein